MDPPEEIIHRQVYRENKPRVVDETQGCSAETSVSAAMSKVLDDNDLLIEILLRISFPTTLVCAALVCKCWFQHVSDHAFLHRFRKLHPPRLLGFYVNTYNRARELPRFVPMLPQPPELDTVIRRVCSSCHTYQNNNLSTWIIDCRNGNLFITKRHEDGKGYTSGVHSLLCSERGMVIMPPCPHPPLQRSIFYSYYKILSKEEEDGGLTYLCALIYLKDSKQNVHVYMLQNGVWKMYHNWSSEYLPSPFSERKFVLLDNKIYIIAAQGKIIVLNLTVSSFSTIQMPQGFEYADINTILSRAHDAIGVYLIHVKKLLLCIWLLKGDDWLLVDTICLREVCASLNMSDSSAFIRIREVGDNAEFVLLEMGQCTIYLDIKCRTLHKLYEIPSIDPWYSRGDIYPVMMIWPPRFPALKVDLARNAV